VLLIAYLGLTSVELLSLAMFAGWARSGVPWTSAVGLVALTGAAIILPLARGQNVYCSHLCPHGAVQQLLPRRWKIRGSLPIGLKRVLMFLRPALLAWALLVTFCRWPFSLVDIEPFDAYSWRAAAWPTIVVALVGLVASVFVPMAYCRYGCPTGALLEYVRRHGRSDRFTRADGFALACAAAGVAFFWFPQLACKP
jgi:polyferredoxin